MIISVFAKLYICMVIIYTVFSDKLRLTKKQFTVIWILFIFSLSLLAYNMTPGYDWDINWHNEFLNQARSSGISFFNFLFKNYSFIGGEDYTGLITFNILRYIVVKTTQNNFLLPAICVVIDYSILGYIIIDWSSQNSNSYKLNIFTLLLSFAFAPYIHAISGMRNILSAAIISLAAYLYLYKNKHIILLIILIFMACTIHPAAMITVPFIFIAKLNIGSLGFVSVFLISLLLTPTAKYLSRSSVAFFALLGRKYLLYTSENQYSSTIVPLYGVLIITAVFLLIYFLMYRRFNMLDKQSEKKTLYNFLAIYMVYIWGNIGNYDMVLRPAYVLGFFAPVLSSFLSDKNIWMRKGFNAKIENIVGLGATAGSLFICLIVNYSFFVSLKNVL